MITQTFIKDRDFIYQRILDSAKSLGWEVVESESNTDTLLLKSPGNFLSVSRRVEVSLFERLDYGCCIFISERPRRGNSIFGGIPPRMDKMLINKVYSLVRKHSSLSTEDN
jgi:hypothetical protein